MKSNRVLILFFVICFHNISLSQDLTNADSLNVQVQQLANQKLELENKITEMNEAATSRNIGYYMGLSSAMIGFLAGALGFYYQFKKTKIATQKLEVAYKELKSTQAQLVKSEKMAAFGVVSSRLSHEILNPLNFVNNFSEMSKEMLQEISADENKINRQENISQLSQTLEKIHEHGKRATAIVKQLQELSAKGIAHEFYEENKLS